MGYYLLPISDLLFSPTVFRGSGQDIDWRAVFWFPLSDERCCLHSISNDLGNPEELD